MGPPQPLSPSDLKRLKKIFLSNCYRAAKIGIPDDRVTLEQWIALVEFVEGYCAYCGFRAPLTMDHMIPFSKGGLHEIGNIAPICQSCNSTKRDRSLENYLAWIAARERDPYNWDLHNFAWKRDYSKVKVCY